MMNRQTVCELAIRFITFWERGDIKVGVLIRSCAWFFKPEEMAIGIASLVASGLLERRVYVLSPSTGSVISRHLGFGTVPSQAIDPANGESFEVGFENLNSIVRRA